MIIIVDHNSTLHGQDLKLFDIVKDGDKYHYNLSLLPLIEMKMKINDILDGNFFQSKRSRNQNHHNMDNHNQ